MKKKKKYEKPVLKIIEVELSCCIAASPFVTGGSNSDDTFNGKDYTDKVIEKGDVVHDGSWGGRSN